eukprot:Gb_28903 [translate_table: standard]
MQSKVLPSTLLQQFECAEHSLGEKLSTKGHRLWHFVTRATDKKEASSSDSKMKHTAVYLASNPCTALISSLNPGTPLCWIWKKWMALGVTKSLKPVKHRNSCRLSTITSPYLFLKG